MESRFKFFKIHEIFFLVLITVSIATVSIEFPNAEAIAPDWGPALFHNTNSGGVPDASIPTSAIIITVNDTASSGTGSIQVSITSSVDPIGFDLTLNEETPGIFKNTNLALMEENNFVTVPSSIIVTVWDDRITNASKIQTLQDPPRIVSDSDKIGISPNYTETGLDTNLYTATINLDSETNSLTNTLKVSPGDIFSIHDGVGGGITSGFVNPNPNVGQGAIITEVPGIVTATYQGDSSSVIIKEGDVGGRGSGGLIKPGLVLDSSGGGNDGNGGGCVNCTPPTLGLNSKSQRIVQQGFSFNDNPIDVEYHFTPYPLITANVGQENKIVLKIFDDGGTQNIEHVGLAFGLSKGQFFSESKATINLDRTLDGREKTSTFDPEKVFDNVKIVTSKVSCNNFSNIQCLEVIIYQTFRESLEFNIVSTNVWDSKKNAWQNFYNHGIEIIGDSLNPPKTKLTAFGEKNMRGLYELTQLDKKKHLWNDEFGNMYEYKGNDRFDRILSTQGEINLDEQTAHGCDRNCNWFINYKMDQEILAEKTLDKILVGKKLEDDFTKEPFSYTFKFTKRAEDLKLQKLVELEKNRAEKIADKLLKPWEYPEFFLK